MFCVSLFWELSLRWMMYWGFRNDIFRISMYVYTRSGIFFGGWFEDRILFKGRWFVKWFSRKCDINYY